MLWKLLPVTLINLWLPPAGAHEFKCAGELVRIHSGKVVLSTEAIEIVIEEMQRQGWDLAPAAIKKRDEDVRAITASKLNVALGAVEFIKKAQFRFGNWTNAIAAIGKFESGRTDWDRVDAFGVLRELSVDGPVNLRAVKVHREARTVELLRARGIKAGAAAFTDALLLRHGNAWDRVLVAAGVGSADASATVSNAELLRALREMGDVSDDRLKRQKALGMNSGEFYKAILSRFGSTRAAMELAGLDSLAREIEDRSRVLSRDEVQSGLRAALAVGVPPAKDEFLLAFADVAQSSHGVEAYSVWRCALAHFGSWSLAWESVGVTVADADPPDRFWTVDRLAQALRFANGEPATNEIRELALSWEGLSDLVRRRFASLEAGLEYAGFDTSELAGPEDDLPAWSRRTFEALIDRLGRDGFTFGPEFLYADADRVADIALEVTGKAISPLSIWRASRSFSDEILANGSGSHTSLSRSRLALSGKTKARDWTPAQVARALRHLHRKFPALNFEDLRGVDNGLVAEEMVGLFGHRFSGHQLTSAALRLFGSWAAALEYAGFNASSVVVHSGLRELSGAEVLKAIGTLRRSFISLQPEEFLTRHVRILELTSLVLNEPISAYAVWRSAIANFGSWRAAVDLVDPNAARRMVGTEHPAVWTERMKLDPSRMSRESASPLPAGAVGFAVRLALDWYPESGAEGLVAKSRAIGERFRRQTGQYISGRQICRDAIANFGSWLAALEFAGFDTGALVDGTDESLSKSVIQRLLRTLEVRKVSLKPDAFLPNFERVGAALVDQMDHPISAYALWRAAITEFGSWPEAVRSIRPVQPWTKEDDKHPSVAPTRVMLARVFSADQSAERERWLRLLQQPMPGSMSAIVGTLREYLDRHHSLENWPGVTRFAERRSCPNVELLPLVLERLEYQFSHLTKAAE